MHHQPSLFCGSNEENATEVVQRKLMQQDCGQCNTVVKKCNFLDLQNLNFIKQMTALDSCDQIPANASPCHSAEIDSMCLGIDLQLNSTSPTSLTSPEPVAASAIEWPICVAPLTICCLGASFS